MRAGTKNGCTLLNGCADAEESMLSGHEISAKDGFLRASNYYRVAEFLLVEPEDQRILDSKIFEE